MSAPGRRWKQKPPRGWPIDRSHTWVKDYRMQGFYALNEGTGGTVVDSMRNLNLAATGFGSANPWKPASQIALNLNTAVSENAYGPLSPSSYANWPVTLVAAFNVPASISGLNPVSIFGISYDTSTAHNVISILCQSGLIAYGHNFGGTFATTASGTSITSPGDYVVSVTVTGRSVQSMYLLGKLILSGTLTDTNPTYTANSSVVIGNLPGNPGHQPSILVYWATWFNSALAGSVHAAIGANVNAIWEIMMPQPDYASMGSQSLAAYGGGDAALRTARPPISGPQRTLIYG